MVRPHLHLVDLNGNAVRPEVQVAVETAFRWVVRDFPLVDSAMVANWAELVAVSMEARADTLISPQRYAYSALKGRIRDWQRTGPAREETVGVDRDLERIGGLTDSFQVQVDRKILFDQLKASLNERDRYILVLLLEDNTSPAVVAGALGTSYSAAAKAIQRVRERIAATLDRSKAFPVPVHHAADPNGMKG